MAENEEDKVQESPAPEEEQAAEVEAKAKTRSRAKATAKTAAAEPEVAEDEKADEPEEDRDPLTVSRFDAEGEAAGTASLPASVFGETPNRGVMHQALLRQLAHRRQGTSATKTRAEVSGGGRKPYRQKGTGHARHGSIREPQMRGGGAVFGPQPRSYLQQMPWKMRRLALRSALSVKAEERRVVVLERLAFEEPKTQSMVELLQRVGVERSALVVLPVANDIVARSTRNLPWAKAILASNLNIYDLFTHDELIVLEDALEVLEETFGPRHKSDRVVIEAATEPASAARSEEE
jgi:large subunit ribosomal protein L4